MDYTGSIYRLIDRAEDEMKEYAQRVKQLSADEIYRHSAETAAKESLLSALIHDSYELDDDDLDLILKPKNPVEAKYYRYHQMLCGCSKAGLQRIYFLEQLRQIFL